MRIPRVRAAAILVLVAELGLLLSVLDEWPQWALRGIFYTVSAIAQGVLLASLLVGPGRKAIRRGAVLNVLFALLWLLSRTVGVPSILTLHRLPVGIVDTLTALAEVGVAVLLIAEWRTARVDQPAVDEPAVSEPAAVDEPAVDQPAVDEPAVDQRA
ncbi:MAG TPA: hypothetical protein VFE14_02905 [Micromonosporaceae bacterium]|jgi:hypothetical protein|nr:hypothetical protein [Micromonosporaceae bacterium]